MPAVYIVMSIDLTNSDDLAASASDVVVSLNDHVIGYTIYHC